MPAILRKEKGREYGLPPPIRAFLQSVSPKKTGFAKESRICSFRASLNFIRTGDRLDVEWCIRGDSQRDMASVDPSNSGVPVPDRNRSSMGLSRSMSTIGPPHSG